MILKVTAFVEIDGHVDNGKILSSMLSEELCELLVNLQETKQIKFTKPFLQSVKVSNPKVSTISFKNYSSVIERLRTSSKPKIG